jgi:hypothetical protein
MMVYRKGEQSSAMVDTGWPHQVAVPESVSLNNGYKAVDAFCKELSLCPRGHRIVHTGQCFNVYCFSERSDAEKFMQRFGGEWFDPKQRGKGKNWMQWKK